MRLHLGIRGRLALAIVLTAAIPLGVAVVLARNMVQTTAQRFFVPEVRQNIEQSLSVYAELARAIKANMRLRADLIAADPALQKAVQSQSLVAIEREFDKQLLAEPSLFALGLESATGDSLAKRRRERDVNEQTEHQLEVRKELTSSGDQTLVAVFVTDKARFDAFEKVGDFVAAYSQLEQRREADEQSYVLAFAVLLGLTIAVSIVVGTGLAGGVTRRVFELLQATRRVATGDLSTRVPEEAKDEIGDLARAFNRMLREVESSRDRIEYLSRLASWQEMARRLAHEIKNPLTPIQLAVQEVHQRLGSLSAEQQQLLDVALEIVETEVQTLRRLVGEFSEFARLPQSHMEECDLVGFLKELEREQGLSLAPQERAGSSEDLPPVLHLSLPEAPALVYLDRQMMRRALLNLLSNAAQAVRGRGRPAHVHFRVSRRQEYYELLLDDDGPGVPQALRSSVFEPYVTTKDDGTGLGLAIVKKIVIEHKGHIEMLESPSGGARVRILLPLAERTSTPVLQPHVDG